MRILILLARVLRRVVRRDHVTADGRWIYVWSRKATQVVVLSPDGRETLPTAFVATGRKALRVFPAEPESSVILANGRVRRIRIADPKRLTEIRL